MTAQACFVDHFAFALGSRKLTVEESVEAGRTRTGAADLLEAGFRYHHVCEEADTAYELAEAAAGSMGDAVAGAGALVYATCIPLNANVAEPGRFERSGDVKDLMDYPASRLQAALGLDDAIVVGLNQQACTSMLGSVRMAGALLASEPEMERVVCLTADRFPPGASYEQAYSLISDGAAACTVSRRPGGYRLLAAHHITNGAMVSADDDETVGAYFSYTHRLVTELLAKAGLATGDVDWVVPQNTNVKAWQILSRLLRIDEERVFCASLPDVAHVISGDNIVNMAYLESRDLVRPGEKVLLAMAGYGMNWQALLLEKV
ncbi:MAG TPA: 3-oxoacyl-[acyl-carrier-protein] synthase III C-terminal domain-containing protein [Acidimicrobiales bacterium]|nr:3-oxoacyl-[acyl-carrier-protein] synthase III C-terminal domain-containing protein [Acidimicrobiales bacterium]